jgi:hypothetical protein
MAERINSQLRRKSKDLNDHQSSINSQDISNFKGSAQAPNTDAARANYRTYPYDYFSGADCRVFYGDIWVDDIVTIQWNVNQSKTPIFGYASQNFDAVAKGQILVQGSIAVAFKEVGYLNLIQATMEAQNRNAGKIIQNKVDTYRALADHKLAKFVPRLTQLGDDPAPNSYSTNYDSNGNPQIIRSNETIEDILLGKKASLGLSKQLGLQEKSRDFEDFAEVLEDSIWGDSNGNPLSLSNQLRRADEFDYNRNGGITTAVGNNYSNVLNILLTFGDINDFRAEHTLVAINDVHFVSTGMIVTPNGDPIGETYNFFARDINKSISNEILASINPIKLDVGNDDLTISKVEDVATIQEYMSRTPDEILIDFEAAFDDYGWSPAQGELTGNFSANRSEPFIDQIIYAVERLFNSLDPEIAKIVDTGKQQYIVKVVGAGTGDTDLVMVLEQGIANTRTYKVISPTRTGFAAKSVITREDLFSNLSELAPPLDTVKSSIDSKQAELDSRQKELDAEQAAFDSASTEVGREDELKKLNDAQERLDRLQEVPEDERSKFRQKQIERQNEKVEQARSEYDDATNFVLSDEYDQGLQDEYRKVANRAQAADDTKTALGERIATARLDRAKKDLIEQQELDVQDRDFSDDELIAFKERTEQADYLGQKEAALAKDEARVDELRKDLRDSLAIAEAEEAKRKQDYATSLDKIRQEDEKRIIAEKELSKKEQDDKNKLLEQERLLRQEESQKAKIDEDLARGLAYDIQGSRVSTGNRGLAITGSTLEHAKEYGEKRANRYGTNRGELVGLDLGDQTRSSIPLPFKLKIESIGTTSIRGRDQFGEIIEIHHIDEKYLDNLDIAQTLDQGTYIPYSEDHIHLQTRGYSGRSFEQNVIRNLEIGEDAYRNTVPTDNPTTEDYTSYDNLVREKFSYQSLTE